ncbi:MAG: hypothetical protein CVU16_06435 [Betaproteobacteria bacterium HGW-Betaproteobacteria-10]|jgi:hypothetical protein|nr:MAG: hypothetical protein CVU16_06435 [Betaproteobacteria bacterium HGW-Betaproteobacteria-10]
MMARIDYRSMSLAGRGLLYSMRLECWVNDQLPADPGMLAKVLGFDANEIKSTLPEVQSFFANVDGFLISPELDNYKIHLEEIRNKQRAGGVKGAKKRYGKKP